MRVALFGAQRNGAADLVGGGKTLFWPQEKAKAKALLEPRSVLDCTRSPSPNNSTSTLSSSLGGGPADSTGVAVVSDSSAAAAEATKWGASGQHGGGGGGKEDWAGGCELPPIPTGLDMEVAGGGESWDAMLGNAAAPGQDQTFLNWIIGAAGDLDQPEPPLPVHQQPLLDNVGFGFPAADPLGFTLDPHLGGVASDMSSPGALSHATNSGGGGNKASSAFGLFSLESASLQPPPPVLFHEGIDRKPPLLGAQPPGLLHQYQHQPTPATTFFMPIPSFPDHNQQSPLVQPPPKRHQSIGDDLYLARNRLLTPAAGQGHAFPPLNVPAPFQLQLSPPPPHGAMKTTAAEAAQQQLLDELAAAAKAAEAGNSIGAREILARLNHQLPPLGKPFLRSASYLKEALLLALAEGHHGGCHLTSPLDVALKLAAYNTFSDHSPVLQFTNFTATQALLDEIVGSTSSCIHVIDFDLGVGGQWASFLQELAHRRGAGGAALPFVKLTAFVSAASHHPLELRLARDNIAQFAADLGIPFEFSAISADMINPSELISASGDEVVAVVLPAGCSARAPPLPAILRLVKQLAPKIVIAIDHGADRADLPFSQHFLNCFQSCMFLLDSLDAAGIDADSAGKIERFLILPRIEDSLLGRGKVDKPIAWRSAFAAAGFVPVPPSNLAEAQADCLLKRVQVRGFHLEKCGVGLTLYWQRGELVTVSAWRC